MLRYYFCLVLMLPHMISSCGFQPLPPLPRNFQKTYPITPYPLSANPLTPIFLAANPPSPHSPTPSPETCIDKNGVTRRISERWGGRIRCNSCTCFCGRDPKNPNKLRPMCGCTKRGCDVRKTKSPRVESSTTSAA